jgi:hypothetical protein
LDDTTSTSEATDTPTTPKADSKRRHSLQSSDLETNESSDEESVQDRMRKRRFGFFGFGRGKWDQSEATSSEYQPDSAATTSGFSTEVKPTRSLGSTSEIPDTPSELMYVRDPPVVYGLFILNSSVFLLTADAAKDDEAYVSFHVDMDFMDRHQSFWNALTVAIAVCMARDELMTRLDDFEELPKVEDSDPDA